MKTPRHATVIAITALVIAVFGTTPLGHAAGRLILPNSSVGTAQLKASAVTGKKVKDGSLYAADFAAGQLPAGAKGDKGDKGDKGEIGAPGMSGYEIANGTLSNVAGGGTLLLQIACPSGKKAIGGGFSGGTNDGVATIFSFPFNNGAGWYLRVKNLGVAATTLQGEAVCVNVS